jgi:hypothetical protein
MSSFGILAMSDLPKYRDPLDSRRLMIRMIAWQEPISNLSAFGRQLSRTPSQGQ